MIHRSYDDPIYGEPHENAERRRFYAEYRRGENCDCELISKEGTSIKVHSFILRKYCCGLTDKPPPGGDLGKVKISFDKYSRPAICVFVESLYLDPETFASNCPTWGIPIFEVLRFADEYKQHMLYSVCIRIIQETATREDAENIRKVNEVCQNFLLSRLYKKLTLTND